MQAWHRCFVLLTSTHGSPQCTAQSALAHVGHSWHDAQLPFSLSAPVFALTASLTCVLYATSGAGRSSCARSFSKKRVFYLTSHYLLHIFDSLNFSSIRGMIYVVFQRVIVTFKFSAYRPTPIFVTSCSPHAVHVFFVELSARRNM